MENEVFGRVYSLVIGRPQRTEVVGKFPFIRQTSVGSFGENPNCVHTPTVNDLNDEARSPIEIERSVIPPEFKEWTDIQFTADVLSSKRGKSVSSTTATLNLFNLSKEDQEFIKKGYVLVLRAGYEQDLSPEQQTRDFSVGQGTVSVASRVLPLLFIGDIVSSATEKRGEDVVTKIKCTDSAYSLRNTRVTASYESGTTYRQVLDDLISKAQEFGLKLGNIYFADNILDPNSIGTTSATSPNLFSNTFSRPSVMLMDTQLPGGYSVYGGLLESIQTVSESIGYNAYICLGKLYIEPKRVPVTKPIIEVKDEGLLYYIRPKEETDEMEGSSVREGGIDVAMPLDARMEVASQLRIVNGDYKGVRDIEEVSFKLDYEGQDWDTVISCVSRQ